eukprot:CAMPEP_0181229954 /NCGR_PEP_ID=MMETSP1096-20121128/34188_1 /TAXON_ID=156174 ORGANISM="Chrysochromulina ericina, Strain CCMP281" /NCGR_SAMPLE_ID=MMETSP1096 /ASSEMBLY_ACC=CAM_ASM_000453 /LENGTH=165 /DNA_ID=CAMNT_0023323643 /DNA_START=78 /DNA_END=575 /DNA_ORIENTATION=-
MSDTVSLIQQWASPFLASAMSDPAMLPVSIMVLSLATFFFIAGCCYRHLCSPRRRRHHHLVPHTADIDHGEWQEKAAPAKSTSRARRKPPRRPPPRVPADAAVQPIALSSSLMVSTPDVETVLAMLPSQQSLKKLGSATGYSQADDDASDWDDESCCSTTRCLSK